MNVYIPYCDFKDGETVWHVLEADTKEMRFWKHSGYDATIIYKNTIYNGENVYMSDAFAWDYINKEPRETLGRIELKILPDEFFMEKRVGAC